MNKMIPLANCKEKERYIHIYYVDFKVIGVYENLNRIVGFHPRMDYLETNITKIIKRSCYFKS